MIHPSKQLGTNHSQSNGVSLDDVAEGLGQVLASHDHLILEVIQVLGGSLNDLALENVRWYHEQSSEEHTKSWQSFGWMPLHQVHALENPYHQEDMKPDALLMNEARSPSQYQDGDNMSYSQKESFKQLPEASS
ncbi:hypothetical protein O181_089552 [Austropuccinia psidii MF-1]|uniref:Uncharacterized protein n=1 Tax=Austropuccinia psidii MF-1 TaxID=1389203 RepID=A0A9Q3ITN8_9BASI|nr:hypothetical protein [Austropuccinia psidii MF-1]